MFRSYFFSLLFPLFVFAQTENEEICPLQNSRATLRHIERGGIGYDQGYTTLEVFLTSDTDKSLLPFFDLRGHVFDNGKFATNAGLGVRTILDCRIYGANIYYDYRNVKKHNYNQLGFGCETLGLRWDFRVNGYLPIGSKTNSYDKVTTSTLTFENFENNYALINQTFSTKFKKQYAMAGINAEAAFHILKNNHIDFYLALGPYYYNYSSKNAIGGKARLKAQIYNYLSLELINSYDNRFHEHIQGAISLNIPLGKKQKSSKTNNLIACKSSCLLKQRFVQNVERQEIIVIDKTSKVKGSNIISSAIDPETNLPYYFVFVDNTSNSNGTYESPYHTLTQAQENSSPNDIIYVFPGDGTTTGMNSGITLQPNQKFWGSSVNHSLQTSQGLLLIPWQTDTYPVITNTNISTNGNAIVLATNNEISGFEINSPLTDSIYGADPQILDVSFCKFIGANRFTLEVLCASNSSLSITNNLFSNNVNGIYAILNDASTISFYNNTFEGQTSTSEAPISILSNLNSFTATIENNLFQNNTTGSILFNLNQVLESTINVTNNVFANNQSGSRGQFGSTCVLRGSDTSDQCSLTFSNNTLSQNGQNSIYLDNSLKITNLEMTVLSNRISNAQGLSALYLATDSDIFTLLATNNLITDCQNPGILLSAPNLTTNATVTINNNTFTNIGNFSGALAISQDFTTLNLTIENNLIDICSGSGIACYSPTGITNFSANVLNNTISNCQNGGSYSASAIFLEQYTNFSATVNNNTFSNNSSPALFIGSALISPSACLELSGNKNDDSYNLNNPNDGTFNLSPCNVEADNRGTINTTGTITHIESCSNHTPCPP